MTESVQIENLDKPVDAAEALQEGDSVTAKDDDQAPVFNRKQATDIAKRERAKGIEQGKRQAMQELQQQQQAQQQGADVAPQNMQQPAQAQPASIGGVPQMSPEQIRQMILQEAPKALQEHANSLQQKQLVESFVAKMQAAETKYPGLETKLNDLDFSMIAPLIKMANDMENTGDIMNELIENPMKMGNLTSLAHTQPKMAAKAMQSLSNSIKTNSEAEAKEKSTREPFDKIKSSSSSGKDDGDMTVSDFRAMHKNSRRR